MLKAERGACLPIDLGGKLSGLSLTQQIVALAFWPLLQNILGVAVGFSDRIIAGHISTPETHESIMDMMGVMMYIGWLMLIMQGSIATGAQALVARAFGAKDYKLAEKATAQSIQLGIITGVLAGIALWLMTPTLAWFFQLNEQASESFHAFMNIVVFSAPMSGVLFVCSSCFRGAGDTWTPFNAIAIVNVVNVAVSWYMAVQLGMGLEGIAWGTVIGWGIGALIILWKLRDTGKSTQLLKITKQDIKLDIPIVRRIVRVGLPQLFEVMGMWAIHAYGIKMISQIGNADEGLLGSHGLAIQIESLSFMPGFALGTAASTLAGQYLGAESKYMAAKAVRACWKIAVVLMGTMGLVIFFCAEPLIHLMSPSGGIQAGRAVSLVMIVAVAQPFFATAMVMKMSMRGAGATSTVMLFSYSIMLIFRVALLTTMIFWFDADLKMVWYIMTLDIMVQAFVFVWVHYRGKWMNAVV